MSYIGKRLRLNRLRNSHGFYFFLAADHQLSNGHVPDLAHIPRWLDLVAKSSGLSGVVLNVGSLRHVPLDFRKEIIPQIMGAPNARGDNLLKKPVGSVLEALRFGANLVSTQLNFDEVSFLTQLESFSMLRLEAADFGVPVLVMINLKDRASLTIDRFLDYVTYASELGGDIIKINLPILAESNVTVISECLAELPPVLLSGDAKGDDFLEVVRLSKTCGFAGLCAGRNIFGRSNPEEIVARVCDIFETVR